MTTKKNYYLLRHIATSLWASDKSLHVFRFRNFTSLPSWWNWLGQTFTRTILLHRLFFFSSFSTSQYHKSAVSFSQEVKRHDAACLVQISWIFHLMIRWNSQRLWYYCLNSFELDDACVHKTPFSNELIWWRNRFVKREIHSPHPCKIVHDRWWAIGLK